MKDKHRTEQETLSRHGSGAEPARTLFFGAVPPADISARILQTWHQCGTAALFRHGRLHLSIHGITTGDWLDPAMIQRARQAPASVRTAPFTLCFDRLSSFGPGLGDSRPLVIRAAQNSRGLSDLAAELRTACRAMGMAPARSQAPIRM